MVDIGLTKLMFLDCLPPEKHWLEKVPNKSTNHKSSQTNEQNWWACGTSQQVQFCKQKMVRIVTRWQVKSELSSSFLSTLSFIREGQRSISGISLYCSWPYFLRPVLSMNWLTSELPQDLYPPMISSVSFGGNHI